MGVEGVVVEGVSLQTSSTAVDNQVQYFQQQPAMSSVAVSQPVTYSVAPSATVPFAAGSPTYMAAGAQSRITVSPEIFSKLARGVPLTPEETAQLSGPGPQTAPPMPSVEALPGQAVPSQMSADQVPVPDSAESVPAAASSVASPLSPSQQAGAKKDKKQKTEKKEKKALKASKTKKEKSCC